MRIAGWLTLLMLMAVAAWQIDEWADPPRIITARGQHIKVADGDSFVIGVQKVRLKGVDAPEYLQTCKDASNIDWQCGKAARASLERMLRLPGLSCAASATDQYGRSIATCSTAGVPDISSAQVLAGMVVTHEYFGVRDYGDEEDKARDAKRGIWIGEFIQPSDWRADYVTLRTNTVPAE